MFDVSNVCANEHVTSLHLGECMGCASTSRMCVRDPGLDQGIG